VFLNLFIYFTACIAICAPLLSISEHGILGCDLNPGLYHKILYASDSFGIIWCYTNVFIDCHWSNQTDEFLCARASYSTY